MGPKRASALLVGWSLVFFLSSAFQSSIWADEPSLSNHFYLIDALGRVFEKLGPDDFNSVRKVSKLWSQASNRVLGNRSRDLGSYNFTHSWGFDKTGSLFLTSEASNALYKSMTELVLRDVNSSKEVYKTRISHSVDRLVVSQEEEVVYGLTDQLIFFSWRYAKGESPVFHSQSSHEKVCCSKFSHSGNTLVFSTDSGKVFFLDTRKTSITKTLDLGKEGRPILDLSSDQGYLALSRESVQNKGKIDIEFIDLMNVIKDDQGIVQPNFKIENQTSEKVVEFGPHLGDGKQTKILLKGYGISIWNIKSDHPIQSCEFYPHSGVGVAHWVSEGTKILTGGPNGKIRLWDGQTCSWIKDLPGPKNWSQQQPMVGYIVKGDKTEYWEYQSGKKIGQIEGAGGQFFSFISRKEVLEIKNLSEDPKILVWDIEEEKVLYEFPIPALKIIHSSWNAQKRILALTFSSESTYLWHLPIDGEEQKAQFLFEVPQEAHSHQFAKINETGNHIVTFGSSGLSVWNVGTGMPVGQSNADLNVQDVAFLKDQKSFYVTAAAAPYLFKFDLKGVRQGHEVKLDSNYLYTTERDRSSIYVNESDLRIEYSYGTSQIWSFSDKKWSAKSPKRWNIRQIHVMPKKNQYIVITGNREAKVFASGF